LLNKVEEEEDSLVVEVSVEVSVEVEDVNNNNKAVIASISDKSIFLNYYK
jgi:hypothetical protein